MTDTPTPRTDKAALDNGYIGSRVPTDFARQLERELAAALAAVKRRDEVIAVLKELAYRHAHDAECPPGDMQDDCPNHECSKCWDNWIDVKLKGEI